MDVGQRLAVHRPHHQCVLLQRLGDRHAARNGVLGRIAGQMRVTTKMAGEFSAWFHPGCGEQVLQRHAGPFSASGAAIGPLVAAPRGAEKRPAIAAAFQHHAVGAGRKALLDLTQAEFERRVHLPVDLDLPGVQVGGGFRDLAVVADEEAADRGRLIIQQVFGGFGDQRAFTEHDQAFVLAGEIQFCGCGPPLCCPLRKGGRDQPGREVLGEGHGAAQRHADGGEAGTMQEAAARWAGVPAENLRVGPFGIRLIKLVEGTFPLCCHVRLLLAPPR